MHPDSNVRIYPEEIIMDVQRFCVCVCVCVVLCVSFFFNLFLAALGLCCCMRAFSSCGERGLLFVAVRGLFIAVVCLAAEHGL